MKRINVALDDLIIPKLFHTFFSNNSQIKFPSETAQLRSFDWC